MGFKKLAIAAAVAVAPMSALALEPMQDEALSAVTGQDGITLGLNANIVAQVIVHDTDGVDDDTATTPAWTGYGNAGAIILEDFAINTGGGNIGIVIDAGDSDAAGAGAMLNVGISIPTGTTVTLGSVDVANSNRDEATPGWGVAATGRVDNVLNLGSVTLGATNLNLQLGTEAQGDMIAMNTTITGGGVKIANFSINDANSGGGITVGNLQVVNTGATATGDLSVGLGINATTNGLVIDLDQVGVAGTGAGTGADVRMTSVNIGGTGNLGDVELVGLNLNGSTLTIAGHN
ncbi:putative pilus system protein FilA [Alcanivorax sediminis]|uniref:DUF6160 domain-containing protein n=1 Tax=Alcanivorax sediminis TaxID=2663008 RepID=A0A6N7M0N4_9GAMM|nr:DUF6160 family protein [Alcanivorax sediminis]MQX54071.1 hypothetical protein [Alcanivorax sediminis]